MSFLRDGVITLQLTEVHNVTRFSAEWASKATVLVNPIQCMDFCFVRCILISQNSNSLWELQDTRSIQKFRRMHELRVWQFPQLDKTEQLLRPRHRHGG